MTKPGEHGVYLLRVPCMACNRIVGESACALCSRMEDAERAIGEPSPQLRLLRPRKVETA